MSEPREQQQEPEELDLDAETVRNLEVPQDVSENVMGGSEEYVCTYRKPV